VPDLLWDEVKDLFDPEVHGVLPDVRVTRTSLADWQAAIDLPRSRGWAYQYEVDGQIVRMPVRIEDVLVRVPHALPAVRVWPYPDLLAIFRPWSVDEVSFDVDLRQLQGQQQLDKLCVLLRAVGRRLQKPVLMYPEGFDVQPDLAYLPEVDRVVLMPK
jgi:hypothetical protein